MMFFLLNETIKFKPYLLVASSSFKFLLSLAICYRSLVLNIVLFQVGDTNRQAVMRGTMKATT